MNLILNIFIIYIFKLLLCHPIFSQWYPTHHWAPLPRQRYSRAAASPVDWRGPDAWDPRERAVASPRRSACACPCACVFIGQLKTERNPKLSGSRRAGENRAAFSHAFFRSVSLQPWGLLDSLREWVVRAVGKKMAEKTKRSVLKMAWKFNRFGLLQAFLLFIALDFNMLTDLGVL